MPSKENETDKGEAVYIVDRRISLESQSISPKFDCSQSSIGVHHSQTSILEQIFRPLLMSNSL